MPEVAASTPTSAPASGPAASGPAASAAATLDLRDFPFTAVSNDGAYFVAARPSSQPVPLNEPFELLVAVTRAEQRDTPLQRVRLDFDADMPEHRHGMNTQPLVSANADGTFTVRGVQLHMPGYWELYADVTQDGVTERAQFSVTLE